MAKVTLATDVVGISGKLCSKEGVIYNVNKKTGKVYRSDRHGYTDKNSAEQQAVRTTFKNKSQAAAVWWNANKPSTENADGTAEYQLVMKKYDAQSKIGNPYSYFRSLIDNTMKVTIGTTVIDLSSGTSSSTTGGTETPNTNLDV